VVNVDALTYAGNLHNLDSVSADPRHHFVKGDIRDRPLLDKLLADHRPGAVVHFAAESHVDRSIHGPGEFVQTNVLGDVHPARVGPRPLERSGRDEKPHFRFHHVSTDEVYGSLDSDAPAFAESSPYQPNSPYAASKAAGDHLSARLASHLPVTRRHD
jgi:dTDP-glucose 4,6-dehydratase